MFCLPNQILLLAPINKGGHLPHDYECRSCATELGNERWLEKQLEEELSKLSYSIHENSEGLRRLSMKIDYLENQVSEVGPRQKRLKESMKNLKLNPARYHGGNFEGKSIQDMLECSRNKSFEILACISDNMIHMKVLRKR